MQKVAMYWLVVVPLVLVTAAAYGQGTPKADTRLTDLPEQLSESVKRDFQDCLPKNGEPTSKVIRITHLNLGNKNQPAFMIQGINQCSGPNNGPMLVYVHLDGSWKKVFQAIGQSLNVLKQRSNGLLGLERWQHGSAFASDRYVYEFDGHGYKSISCNVVSFVDMLTGKEYKTPRCEPCSWNWKDGNP